MYNIAYITTSHSSNNNYMQAERLANRFWALKISVLDDSLYLAKIISRTKFAKNKKLKCTTKQTVKYLINVEIILDAHMHNCKINNFLHVFQWETEYNFIH